MSDIPVLTISRRDKTGKGGLREIRESQLVPGIVYGGNEQPLMITVQQNELKRALGRGRFLSTLFALSLGSKSIKVIAREVQRNPINEIPTHIDFLRLTDQSRVTLFIPVEFTNRHLSPGLKSEGVLNVVRHEVEISVIAGKIPEHLVVDLTGLDFGDVIHISSISLPESAVPVIRDRDFTIATIAAPSTISLASDEEVESPEDDTEAAT
jgi:large subunit ribosomal protein L25